MVNCTTAVPSPHHSCDGHVRLHSVNAFILSAEQLCGLIGELSHPGKIGSSSQTRPIKFFSAGGSGGGGGIVSLSESKNRLIIRNCTLVFIGTDANLNCTGGRILPSQILGNATGTNPNTPHRQTAFPVRRMAPPVGYLMRLIVVRDYSR